MATVNRLGESFDWGQVKIMLFDTEVIGVTEITYDVERDFQSNYGAGYTPVSTGKGQKKYTGSISLDQKEIRSIMQAASNLNDMTDLPPFEITVVVSNDETNETFTDVLHQCRFKKQGLTAKRGDMEMNHQIPLHVSGFTPGK